MSAINQFSPQPKVLPGFERVHRFWDKQKKIYVVKILPGEFFVTKEPELIATTLGSCVTACIWDDVNNIGGMNHFMLPLTEQKASEVQWSNTLSDATRYGNYAMEHLINEILKNGGVRKHLRAKAFGGGNILDQLTDVGQKNAEFVLEYLDLENIPLIAKDLGGSNPRKLIFDPLSAKVQLKKLPRVRKAAIAQEEQSYQEVIGRDSSGGEVELFD